MADDKIKTRQRELIGMTSNFCDEYLDDEYKQLCIRLTEKLGRKREVPFKRGKLENWASGIVYVIGQLNFLFDDSFEPYATPDDICGYFKTKKSTASNKARDIRKLLNLKLGNEEFSTELVSEYDLSGLSGDLSQVKTLEGAERYSNLHNIGRIFRKIHEDNTGNDDLKDIIHNISTNPDYTVPDKKLIGVLMDSKFISPTLDGTILRVSDSHERQYIPAFTGMDEYNDDSENALFPPVEWEFKFLVVLIKGMDVEGIIVNPNKDNFFVSKEFIENIGF